MNQPMANDEAADKRQADAAARELLLKSFAGKMCPYLSIGGLRPATSLVGAMGGPLNSGAEGEALSCQGPNCMKFIITTGDDAGRATGGACADALLPAAILQLRDANLSIAKQFIGNYKIKPV